MGVALWLRFFWLKVKQNDLWVINCEEASSRPFALEICHGPSGCFPSLSRRKTFPSAPTVPHSWFWMRHCPSLDHSVSEKASGHSLLYRNWCWW